MAAFIIFAVAIFVSVLTLSGLFYTVREIRYMGVNPEKYRPKVARAFFR
jgi:hypothetical protein